MAVFTDERIQQMMHGRRFVRRVVFPGTTDVELGVRILLDHEVDKARVGAIEYCKRSRADIDVDPDFLERERERQIIWLAYVDIEDQSDNPRPFFPSDRDVRTLDTVTIRRLFDIYLDHQETICPHLSLSEEEVGDLIEALKKAPDERAILAYYARDTLVTCIRSMASLLATSRGHSSSDSSSSRS